MDSRIRRHAEILVDHSLNVQPTENVLISARPCHQELVVALHEEIGKRDANALTINVDDRASRAYRREVDPDKVTLNEHELAAVEAADKIALLWGMENTNEANDVDNEVASVLGALRKPILEERMATPWVGTLHPTTGNAQETGMSTEGFATLIYDAVNQDWEAQRECQQHLVEILDDADEVRIVSGDETDVRMSVAGMKAINDYGKKNLPGGEVATAPVPDSVEGEVSFDMPVLIHGERIEGVSLRFEDGVVVDYDANNDNGELQSLLDRDEGARRVGELGFGMNRHIDQFTSQILLDEKMNGTIHLALGRAMRQTVPEGRPYNDSSVHKDILLDVTEDSFVEVDGEIIQRDGTFVFEE